MTETILASLGRLACGDHRVAEQEDYGSDHQRDAEKPGDSVGTPEGKVPRKSKEVEILNREEDKSQAKSLGSTGL